MPSKAASAHSPTGLNSKADAFVHGWVEAGWAEAGWATRQVAGTGFGDGAQQVCGDVVLVAVISIEVKG